MHRCSLNFQNAANPDHIPQHSSKFTLNPFNMTVSFPDLTKAEGLQALNDHLAPYSYIDG